MQLLRWEIDSWYADFVNFSYICCQNSENAVEISNIPNECDTDIRPIARIFKRGITCMDV